MMNETELLANLNENEELNENDLNDVSGGCPWGRPRPPYPFPRPIIIRPYPRPRPFPRHW